MGSCSCRRTGLRRRRRHDAGRAASPTRVFATKIELGWKMIQRARDPDEAVACATREGRSVWLRRQRAGAGLRYLAEVPATTQVSLSAPVVGVPPRQPGRGAHPTKRRVLAGQPLEVRPGAQREDTLWHRVPVRHTERGVRADAFATRPLWTTYTNEPGPAAVGPPVRAWRVLRGREEGTRSSALCNAPAEASLERRTWLKWQPYCGAQHRGREVRTRLGRPRGPEVPGVGAPPGLDGAGGLVRGPDQAGVGTEGPA